MSALDDVAEQYAEALGLHQAGKCGEFCYWCEQEDECDEEDCLEHDHGKGRERMPSEYIYRPLPDSPFAMSKEDVADWFLRLHGEWFTEPTNDLCGCLEVCRNALLRYLDGGLAPNEGSRAGYVVMKFRREVEPWFVKKEEENAN